MIDNAEFGRRLRECRDAMGLSQRDLALRSGISHSNISRYEKGSHGAGREAASQLAKILGVNTFWLMGADVPKLAALPEGMNKVISVLGRVAAGIPIEAQEDVLERIPVAPSYGVDFGLRVHGESMIGIGIKDGDTVLIRQQTTLENGEIGVIEIAGEVTLKRFYKDASKVMLLSENSNIPPIMVTGREASEKNLRIIGKAIKYVGEVREVT